MRIAKRGAFGFRLSTYGKVIAGYLALGVGLLTASFFITKDLAVNTMQEKIEGTLMSTALSLADSVWVEDMLKEQRPNHALFAYLDSLIERTQDISLITIVDNAAIRLYHFNKDLIGEHFVGGDEGPALEGESYFSNAVGTMGYQHRAFAPVYDEENRQIGFVVVSKMMSQLDNMHREVVTPYLHVTLILIPVTVLITFGLSASIREELMGFEPDKLVRLFITRGDVLDALEEGILSVEEEGAILYANQAAARILDARDDLQGQNLLSYLDEHHRDILRSPLPIHNWEMTVGDSTVLYDRLPPKNTDQGFTIILRNKNDATHLAEELTGSKHIISALRANTHEFMNKLHVIWGLLNMGQTEEACKYISHISELQEESITPIMRTIHDPTIAGLLLGKISHMREMDIYFALNRLSTLPQQSQYLSTRQLVTVVGNLIENAIEAINEQDVPGERQIELQITEDANGLTIWIDDTGIGMSAENLEMAFEQGYSTKGEGRGVGMSLIREIVDSCGGTIEVESEIGTGTSITIFINEQRKGGAL